MNGDADDRDPWLSSDGLRLYFASDREGEFDLYVADLANTEQEQGWAFCWIR